MGFDPDRAVAAYVLGAGIVDAAAADLAALWSAGETLVVAAPLEETVRVLDEAARRGLRGPALVVDVASVKGPVAPFAGRVAGFVPTHPLAGAEGSGPATSRADLFAGRAWAYVPTGNPELDARAAAFIGEMGAHPFPVDALRHDRIVALTSHVPQLLSTALANVLAADADPAAATLHGPGLESMLRLARSPWPMWEPILAANRTSVASGLRSLAETLGDAARALERGDGTALGALFERANAFAAQLEAREV